MDQEQKRQEFKISIRRKRVNHTMEAMRSMVQLEHIQQSDAFKNCQEIIKQIREGKTEIEKKLRELKILSWSEQTAMAMINNSISEMLEGYTINHQLNDEQFNDIMTIFINFSVYLQIQQLSQHFFLTVAKGFLSPSRYRCSLWLLSNIIYQKGKYSAEVTKHLINQCNFLSLMEERMKESFQIESDLTMFNYFCGSFLGFAELLKYEDYCRIIKLLETIDKFQNFHEANFFLFSCALVDHNIESLSLHQYYIFKSPLMEHFSEICKKKKTKVITNYLKFLINFSNQDSKPYSNFLRFGIFNNLDFCLQNRFPGVKSQCLEVGLNLLQKEKEAIDFESIDFFSVLGFQFINYGKYALDSQILALKYGDIFIKLSLEHKISEHLNNFLKETSPIITALSTLITTSNGNAALLFPCLSILATLLEADSEEAVKKYCTEQNFLVFLNHLHTENPELKTQIERLFKYF